MKRINIFDMTQVDGDSEYFNRQSLKSLGVPENADFSVRFKSNVPIVVTNRGHMAAYKSENR